MLPLLVMSISILLARALVSRPRLLLLDEVLNGLDEINRARMLRWLGHQTGRLPWVLATHRLEDVPPSATHALVLSHGRIVYRGRIDDRYVDLGLERPAPTKHDLADALAAVVDGKPVQQATTQAVGCFIADLAR